MSTKYIFSKSRYLCLNSAKANPRIYVNAMFLSLQDMDCKHLLQEHKNLEKWGIKSQFCPAMSHAKIKKTIGTAMMRGKSRRTRNRIIFEYTSKEYVGYCFGDQNCQITRSTRVVVTNDYQLITAYPITAGELQN